MKTNTLNRHIKFHTGDVVEVETETGTVSALVLLATEEFVILDSCDDSTPVVVRTEDLISARVYDGSLA
jgi:hypothetical protein